MHSNNKEAPYGKVIVDGKAAHFDAPLMDSARNAEGLKQIRRDMMEGKQPPACNLCWKEEALGIFTKRQTMLRIYNMARLLSHTEADGTIDTDNLPLHYLDLRLGNLCNLKCRSCGATDSSLWIADHAKLYPRKDGTAPLLFYGSKVYNILPDGNDYRIDSNDFEWYNNPDFHTWMDERIMHGLNRIYFTGGEPSINKHHMAVLDRIIELEKASDFVLEYNSNMIAIPPRLLKQWSQFKEVHIGASIDAMGPLAHYVRHPTNWNFIERTLDQIGYGQIPSIIAGFSTTISILNIRQFVEMSRWLITKFYTSIRKYPSWHLLHEPPYYSIQCLPFDMKVIVEGEFEEFFQWVEKNFGKAEAIGVRNNYAGIIRFMKQKSTTHRLKELKEITLKLDKIRNEKMADHLPWLAEILEI